MQNRRLEARQRALADLLDHRKPLSAIIEEMVPLVAYPLALDTDMHRIDSGVATEYYLAADPDFPPNSRKQMHEIARAVMMLHRPEHPAIRYLRKIENDAFVFFEMGVAWPAEERNYVFISCLSKSDTFCAFSHMALDDLFALLTDLYERPIETPTLARSALEASYRHFRAILAERDHRRAA